MTQANAENISRGSTWSTLLLGIALFLCGLVVLGDIALATVISAMIIGVALIVSGAFEILYAVWAGRLRGFLWHTLLGICYIVFGFILVTQPVVGTLILTWIIGVVLVVSGAIRATLGLRWTSKGGWMVFMSGLFGLLAGILILVRWPDSSLWVIGAFLGIDLILHGAGWIVAALSPRSDVSVTGHGA